MTSCCARPRTGRCSPASGSPASPCSRSEDGAFRPPAIVVVAFILIAIYATVGYVKGVVNGKEMSTRVRDVILLNPMMKDDEFVKRTLEAAAALGVKVDEKSIAIERGMSVMGGAAISRVRLAYDSPIHIGPLHFNKHFQAEVRP